MSSPLPEDVRSAMAAGQKIEAIRLLRKHTGLGLADAKAAVEAGNLPDSNRSQPVIREIPAQAQAALVAGEALQAIRLVREAYGIGLKEAKDIVDAHGQYHGVKVAVPEALRQGRWLGRRSVAWYLWLSCWSSGLSHG